MTPHRVGLVAFVVCAGLVAAAGVVARLRARRWSSIVERLCACNEATLAQMRALRAVPAGGLDRVLAAQERGLVAGCDRLRAAVQTRSVVATLRSDVLDVVVSGAHARAQRDVARELALLCGDEHRVFWEGLRASVARDAPAADGALRAVVGRAATHLRVRDSMCARRAVLGAPPQPYVLTRAAAEHDARQCERR